jgi:uncharacterized protein (TIGR02265 family)
MAAVKSSIAPLSGEAAFIEPPWSSTLDCDAVLARIPDDAAISGMFTAPLLAEAKRLQVRLPSARDRYLPFQFYPLREHARLLVEASAAFYPERSIRRALRSLGRAAPKALLASTLGKVVFAGVSGMHEAVLALTNSYSINVRPSRGLVIESTGNRAIVRLQNVWYFLDSHHVGAYEGLLRHVRLDGRVLFRSLASDSAELLIEW